MASRNESNGVRFRVSDAVAVPLRGMLLRLRRVEGRPSMKRLAKGSKLHLVAPDGTERDVTIVDYSATGGRATQERLDRTGELDVVISAEDAIADDTPVEIGWYATVP